MTSEIIVGDCRDVLATLPDASVQCCVTSPPYFGLRDYGVAGQMGLESTLSEYIAGMVAVFREVRRVLKDDGVLWLNIGDSYCSHDPGGKRDGEFLNPGGRQSDASKGARNRAGTFARGQMGLKQKDLMMVPARLAIALQDDGWWLRSDVIWHKPNPMPESVRDRPTSAHEHIFLLTKSSRYYYDAAAIAEPVEQPDRVRSDVIGGKNGHLVRNSPGGMYVQNKQDALGKQTYTGFNASIPSRVESGTTRNVRNVWTVPTQGYSGSHFAVMPSEIARRCILAGSREGDTVLDPFSGAGTTGLVVSRLDRNYIGIELNPEYAEMSRRRIYDDAPLFASP